MDAVDVLTCTACGTLHLPPRRRCRSCGADSLRAEQIVNEGELLTYTVIRVPPARYAGAEYTVAAGRFGGSLTITGRLVEEEATGSPVADLEPGRPIRLARREGQAFWLTLAPPGKPGRQGGAPT